MLAPARLEKLDLVVQTEAAEGRDTLGPLDHLEKRGLDAFEEILQLDVAGLLLDGLGLVLGLHVSVDQHGDGDLGGGVGRVKWGWCEGSCLWSEHAGGWSGRAIKLHLEVGEGAVHSTGGMGEHSWDRAGGGVKVLGEVGDGWGDEVEVGEAQRSWGACSMQLGTLWGAFFLNS